MRRHERTAALTVFLLLAGCAVAPADRSRPPEGLTWGGYLYGEDLRRSCTAEGPDRYRFIINGDRPGTPVRIYEAVGRAEEGGHLEVRDFAIGRVADIGPGEPFRDGAGATAGTDPGGRLPLDAGQFAALGERLVTSGLLMPPSSAPDLTRGHTRWFATGCRAGYWFLAANAGGHPAARDAASAPAFSPRRR